MFSIHVVLNSFQFKTLGIIKKNMNGPETTRRGGVLIKKESAIILLNCIVDIQDFILALIYHNGLR